MVRQPGLFDVEERLRELSAKGDDLERIAALVDFVMCRAELERAVPRAAAGDRAHGEGAKWYALHRRHNERCATSPEGSQTFASGGRRRARSRLNGMNRVMSARFAHSIPDGNPTGC